MKKASIIFFALFLGIVAKSWAQSTDSTATPAATDYFAGKWEISVIGTPNGDTKLVAELVRKEGKLSGELKDPSGALPGAIPITDIEETKEQVTIFFSAQGYDVNLVLTKVDQNNCKGSLMGMFDSTAKRVKDK